VRVLAAVDRSIDSVIRRPQAPPAVLHDLHRDLRRLAGGLAVWARVLPRPEAARLEALIPRARRLARLVGRVRDKDVTIALFDRHARAADDPQEVQRLRRFLMRQRDDAHTGRELLRAFLRTERDGGLFADLAGFLARPPARRPSANLGRLLAGEAAARQSRLDKARAKARRRPTPQRLHRLRIRVRQLRHFADLAAPVASDSVARVPPSLRRLQGRLGRLHDLDVALSTLDPDLLDTAWARRLDEQRRTMRREARAVLAAPAPSGNARTVGRRAPRS
jgi:CHAD domain-containing protein